MGDEMMDQGRLIAEFMDIAGCDDSVASSVLESCNWQLEQVSDELANSLG